jgi:hypothetical protein
MSTITAEEWLRDYTKNERYRNTSRGVHAVRSLFDVLPNHTCRSETCAGDSVKIMRVNWDQVGGLNPRPEYPTLLTAPPQADTNGPA